MTLGRLLLRNLFYHRRGNVAVLLGVAVGALVLTGALLVGDSLRGSLAELTLRRLGWVDRALISGRFFRQELASELAAADPGARVSPVLLLQGSITVEAESSEGMGSAAPARAGQVALLGVNESFWPDNQAPGGAEFWQSDQPEVVLNHRLASDLGVSPGTRLTLHLPRASAVPRESLLGRREDAIDRLPLTVREVLPDDAPGARFDLNPTTAEPRNAFVPLRTLQNALNRVPPGQRGQKKLKLPLERPINGLLVGGGSADPQAALASHLRLEDWGLVLRNPADRARAFFDSLDRDHNGKLTPREWPRLRDEAFTRQLDRNGDGTIDAAELEAYYSRQHPYLSLESRQLFIESAVAAAAKEAASKTGLAEAPTLVYLADRIADATDPARQMSYAVVAALDPALPPPLGPFLPPGVDHLGDGEIVLTGWAESPLNRDSKVREVILGYYPAEETGSSSENDKPQEVKLRVAGWLPMQGPADDPDLAPEFPGITDQFSLAEWDPPPSLHFSGKRVQKPRDEDYWQRYRTTPKAYVTLATGRRLWGSRFGDLTSIRVAPAKGGDLSRAEADFRRELPASLRPEQGGFAFLPVRERALQASDKGTEFGWLFVGFSFFLIAAALLLVALLFRLNLDRRASELGLLLAAGYRRRTVQWLLLGEGSLLALAGGLLGLAGALLYAWLLLEWLIARWPGLADRSFLRLHATPESFLYGYLAAFGVSVLTIAWAVRVLGRVSPSALLAGEPAGEEGGSARGPRWSRWVGGLALVGAAGSVAAGAWARDQETQAMSFFGSGALLLTAGLAWLWAWMRGRGRAGGFRGLALVRLGIRNAARHPVRSLLTAGLLASAAFLVVAVESFHKGPSRDFLDPHSGSGGFALLAQSDLPVYQDLNSPGGQDELNFSQPARRELQGVTVFPLRLRAGDDASCLNLYQPGQPRLLGATPQLIQRDGFAFQAVEAPPGGTPDNPWRLLEQPLPEGVVPVFGDANTVVWMLGSKLGGEVKVKDEQGREARLRVVGLFQDSIFQSELVMSEANFLRLYPHQEGYRFFLVDTGAKDPKAVRKVLEAELADHGFEVTPTAERVAAYQAVENTYLSTFQALGGLGLVLGALGLAVVLLRGVWERRGELALLRALGFRRAALAWLVLAENGFLLILGLGLGVLAALVAVAPPLMTGAGEVPWERLLVLIGLVLAVGLASCAAAVTSTLRAPLLPALRRE